MSAGSRKEGKYLLLILNLLLKHPLNAKLAIGMSANCDPTINKH